MRRIKHKYSGIFLCEHIGIEAEDLRKLEIFRNDKK